MPLDDALRMLGRNFTQYLSSLRGGGGGGGGKQEPSVPFLLQLMIDGRHLNITEYDRVIKYLQERRDRLILAEGGMVGSGKPTGIFHFHFRFRFFFCVCAIY